MRARAKKLRAAGATPAQPVSRVLRKLRSVELPSPSRAPHAWEAPAEKPAQPRRFADYLLSLRFAYPVAQLERRHDWAAVDTATFDWLRSYGLLGSHRLEQGLRRTQPGKLAAFAYGYAPLPIVRLASDLIAWLFLFDDCFADGDLHRDEAALRRRHEAFLSILSLRFHDVPNEPFALSLVDLLRRFQVVSPEAWLRRLCASILRYFRGCEREISFRTGSGTPSLEDYLAYRDGSIGVYPVLDLVELAQGCFLSEQDAASDSMAHCRRLANLASALNNDLFSARKEAGEDEAFNIVVVMAREQGVDLPRAIQLSIHQHNQLLAELRRSQAAWYAEADTAVHAFFAGTYVWLQANFEWSSEVPRYAEAPVPPAWASLPR